MTKKYFKMIYIPIAWLVLILIIKISSPRPPSIGLTNNKFTPCPTSPNCVSSMAPPGDQSHYVTPLSFKDKDLIKSQILELKELNGYSLISHENNYFYFECTTLLMRYTDDLEILIVPEQNLIHIRSASRLGHSDLGANRKRVEFIRKQLTLQ